jgi:hypothetical protein
LTQDLYVLSYGGLSYDACGKVVNELIVCSGGVDNEGLGTLNWLRIDYPIDVYGYCVSRPSSINLWFKNLRNDY